MEPDLRYYQKGQECCERTWRGGSMGTIQVVDR